MARINLQTHGNHKDSRDPGQPATAALGPRPMVGGSLGRGGRRRVVVVDGTLDFLCEAAACLCCTWKM